MPIYSGAASGGVTSIATTSPISGGTITGTGTISLLVNTDFAFTAAQSVTKTAAAAIVDGLILTNATAAVNGAQQWSPGLRLSGNYWNGSASKRADWIIYNKPAQTGDTFLLFGAQLDGGGYTTVLSLQANPGFPISRFTGVMVADQVSSNGAIGMGSAGGNITINSGNGNGITWGDLSLFKDAPNTFGIQNTTNAQKVRIYNTITTVSTAGEWWKQDWITTANQFRMGATSGSSSGTARAASWDYGAKEASPTAAITVPATSGSIVFGGPAQVPVYTVATLPAGAEGAIAAVSDAIAPVFLGVLTGGGTVHTPVYYNGTAWVAI